MSIHNDTKLCTNNNNDKEEEKETNPNFSCSCIIVDQSLIRLSSRTAAPIDGAGAAARLPDILQCSMCARVLHYAN